MTLGNVYFLLTAVVRREGASRVYKIMTAADTTTQSLSESLVKGHVRGNIVGKAFVVESRNHKIPGDV